MDDILISIKKINMGRKMNISAFTHVGTVRESNQDSILVNGQIINEGEIHLYNQEKCICFVADGVGGVKGGDFASKFVLEGIQANQDKLLLDTEQILKKININLIESTNTNIELRGCCSTLTGMLIQDNYLKTIHAGDSEIWLLRNDMFFKTTTDQVLDETIKNSPITSYFGGDGNCLKLVFDAYVSDFLIDDLFLICSDGLFKSLKQRVVKSILKADNELETKSKIILDNCLLEGAVDNISVILIGQTK